MKKMSVVFLVSFAVGASSLAEDSTATGGDVTRAQVDAVVTSTIKMRQDSFITTAILVSLGKEAAPSDSLERAAVEQYLIGAPGQKTVYSALRKLSELGLVIVDPHLDCPGVPRSGNVISKEDYEKLTHSGHLCIDDAVYITCGSTVSPGVMNPGNCLYDEALAYLKKSFAYNAANDQWEPLPAASPSPSALADVTAALQGARAKTPSAERVEPDAAGKNVQAASAQPRGIAAASAKSQAAAR